MREVRRYILFAAILLLYMAAVMLLFGQCRLFQNAYQGLERLISHPSIEVFREQEE